MGVVADAGIVPPYGGCVNLFGSWHTSCMNNDTHPIRKVHAHQVGFGDTIVGRRHSFEVIAADTRDGVTKITTVSSYGAVRSEFYPPHARIAVVA